MTFMCFHDLVFTKTYTNISCFGSYGLYLTIEMDNEARFGVIFRNTNIYLHKTLTFNFGFFNNTGFINISLENCILKSVRESEPETKL